VCLARRPRYHELSHAGLLPEGCPAGRALRGASALAADVAPTVGAGGSLRLWSAELAVFCSGHAKQSGSWGEVVRLKLQLDVG